MNYQQCVHLNKIFTMVLPVWIGKLHISCNDVYVYVCMFMYMIYMHIIYTCMNIILMCMIYMYMYMIYVYIVYTYLFVTIIKEVMSLKESSKLPGEREVKMIFLFICETLQKTQLKNVIFYIA